jgi:uncharacterized alpha-E superfamily protein
MSNLTPPINTEWLGRYMARVANTARLCQVLEHRTRTCRDNIRPHVEYLYIAANRLYAKALMGQPE